MRSVPPSQACPDGRSFTMPPQASQPGRRLNYPRPVQAIAFHPDGQELRDRVRPLEQPHRTGRSALLGSARSPRRARPWITPARRWRSHSVRTEPSCSRDTGTARPDCGTSLRPAHRSCCRTKGRSSLLRSRPMATRMLTGSFDGAFRLWDRHGRLLGPPVRQGHMVDDVAVQPRRQVRFGQQSHQVCENLGSRRPSAAAEHRDDPTKFPMAVSADRRTILTQDADHTVVLRDAATNQPVGKPLPLARPLRIGGTTVVPIQQCACSARPTPRADR